MVETTRRIRRAAVAALCNSPLVSGGELHDGGDDGVPQHYDQQDHLRHDAPTQARQTTSLPSGKLP
jgi:hypothetical protein